MAEKKAKELKDLLYNAKAEFIQSTGYGSQLSAKGGKHYTKGHTFLNAALSALNEQPCKDMQCQICGKNFSSKEAGGIICPYCKPKEQPVCKTCKHHRGVTSDLYCHKWEDACKKVTGLCRESCSDWEQNPACQQPPDSEIIKSVKAIIQEAGLSDYENHYLNEACSRLDAQQQRIKELKDVIAKGFDKAAQRLLKPLESQLAKRDEAIRFLKSKYYVLSKKVQESYSTYPATEFEEELVKQLKHILGDKVFRKVIKDG